MTAVVVVVVVWAGAEIVDGVGVGSSLGSGSDLRCICFFLR